jgi:hypothetical protein
MTTYTVSYSKAHEITRLIGTFNTPEEAETAARKAGAVGEGQNAGGCRVYDVDGHEEDDDYGIWIEEGKR